jgi:hypothetical protein
MIAIIRFSALTCDLEGSLDEPLLNSPEKLLYFLLYIADNLFHQPYISYSFPEHQRVLWHKMEKTENKECYLDA